MAERATGSSTSPRGDGGRISQGRSGQETCAAYGVRVGCFRPPSVPRGQACLRLTGRASLTEDDFAAAARALAAVRDDED
jgi:hypothetical protein